MRGGRHVLLLGLLAIVVACAAPATSRPPVPAAEAARSSGGPAVEAPATPPALRKLTIAIVSPNEAMATPWVGQDSGIFARHGFDAEVLVVGGSPRVTQSLIAGDFDYAIAGASSLIRARIQGADPTILATANNTAGSFKLLIVPNSGVRSVEDLRGKIVGVTQYGSDADVSLRYILAGHGLTADDVTIVQHGGSPQGAAALVNGSLQAAMVGGSAILTATRAGMVSIASAREYDVPGLLGTIAATRRYIDKNRNDVQRFVRAYVEAVHYFKTEREETISILERRFAGLPRDEVAFLYDDVRDLLLDLPMPSDEAIHAVAERETEPGAPVQPPSDFVDRSFLLAVEQSGLLQQLYR
jgi:NitT/TauT family transport system substrate-binding protein